MFRDKLGREIDVGDLIVIGTYSNQIDIVRVTSFSKNNNLVGRTYWRPGGVGWSKEETLDNFKELLKHPPNGWMRWTSAPETKCLILSKGKK